MTSRLIDTIVNESNGKNLAVEIYESAPGFVLNYFINGVPAGEKHTTGSLEYVKREAISWIDGVKVING